MLECPSLSSPSPTRWKFRRTEALGGLSVISALHLGTPHHPQGRVFPTATCQRHCFRQLTLGLAHKANASRRPVNRPRQGPGVFSSLAAPSLTKVPRGGGEAASVPAGLRARRFAEKQYTRRLVIPWALLGGQLCSKWWKMREIRQSRDLAGLRGSWLERGGNPLCVRNAVSHVTLGRVPRAPIDMDPAPNRFPPAGRV